MKSRVTTAAAAALLALAGCNNLPGGGNGSGGASSQPPQIAAAELQRVAQDSRVRHFYEARSWQAVWSSEREQALLAALRDSSRHGLDPRRFLRDVEGASGAAAHEAALTLAAFNYAETLARGQADPGRLFEIYTLPRPETDVAAGFAHAVDQGNVPQWLAGLAPNDPEYRALSEAYVRYSEAASHEQPPAVRGGSSIHVGARDPRMPAIIQSLRMQGYLPAQAPAPSAQAQPQPQGNAQATARPQPAAQQDATRYTPELAAAVRRLQEAYGMDADGVIGGGTLDILNATARDRARQIAVNMERRRWLLRTAPQTRIDVNTAAAFLEYYRDGALADTRRVMVGQPGWETPSLFSPIVRLVANPPWTVPPNIERRELGNVSAAYMARNHFVRRNGRLVQLPGPTSALGMVKLDMNNRHAIYLHDTPSKGGFSRAERHLSHGCVRVQDAVAFATMLAAQDGKRDQFERALARRDDENIPREGSIQLSHEIPVRMLYHTVYLDRGGHLLFRPDPYGWDDRVAQALGLAARERPQIRQHSADVGP